MKKSIIAVFVLCTVVMAGVSDIKTGLLSAARDIQKSRREVSRIVALVNSAYDRMNTMPQKYDALITEIEALDPESPFGALANEELDSLTSEFIKLKQKISAVKTVIDTLTY